MCAILTDTELYAFIVPSLKRHDLHRDGRYALHSFAAEANEDAFYLTGRAGLIGDKETIKALATQFAAERRMPEPPAEIASWELFSFDIASGLLTRTTGHGDPSPRHTVWHAPLPRCDGARSGGHRARNTCFPGPVPTVYAGQRFNHARVAERQTRRT